MGKKRGGGEKDLFHAQGNSTIGLPSNLRGKTVKTNPHATPGKLLATKKVTRKGWNK